MGGKGGEMRFDLLDASFNIVISITENGYPRIRTRRIPSIGSRDRSS